MEVDLQGKESERSLATWHHTGLDGEASVMANALPAVLAGVSFYNTPMVILTFFVGWGGIGPGLQHGTVFLVVPFETLPRKLVLRATHQDNRGSFALLEGMVPLIEGGGLKVVFLELRKLRTCWLVVMMGPRNPK